MSTTIRWTSGLFLVIALASACSTMVLPVRGGATIRPRWPLPIGEIRSITRVAAAPVSSRSRSCGNSGVSSPNAGRSVPGGSPFTVCACTIAGHFAREERDDRAVPVTMSPGRSPSERTWAWETYTSCGPGR